MRSHLEMLEQEKVAAGMNPEEARFAAMRQFGWAETIKEDCREQRGVRWLEDIVQDVRYGLRQLRKSPFFALVAITTLALGIGATTAMFSIVDILLWRAPLHVRDAERLVRVYPKGWWKSEGRSYPDYADLRDGTKSFEAVAAYQPGTELALGEGVAARQVQITRTTSSFLPLLGVSPVAGRFFTKEEEGMPDAQPVAVISHELWRTQFSKATNAVGTAIKVGRHSYTIVGVMPAGFAGVELGKTDVWLPLGTITSDSQWRSWPSDRGSYWLRVIGRLKPGVSREAADRDASAANQRGWLASGLKPDGEVMRIGGLMRSRDSQESKEVKITLWLGWVAISVGLIASANVAGLLLMRMDERRKEISMRSALGAGRGRIIRQWMMESLLLGLAAGAAALLVAHVVTSVIQAFLLPGNTTATSISSRTLIFAGASALATGLICGLIPALRSGQIGLAAALKAGSGSCLPSQSRTRAALLVGQIALTFVLLIGSGLFIRSLQTAGKVALGIDADQLLTLTTQLDGDDQRNEELYRSLYERLKNRPGIQSVTLAVTAPFRSGWLQRIIPKGREGLTQPEFGRDFFNEQINCVTAEFFTTTGLRILRGRGFTSEDRTGAPPVMIVNEAMARMIEPGGNVLGRLFHVQGDQAPLAEIIGVSTDSKISEIQGDFIPQYYVPFDQPMIRGKSQMRALLIRTQGKAEAMVETVRRELSAGQSNLPYLDVRAMRSELEPQLLPWRLGATMFSLFGILALTIAAVGIYGTVGYAVTQRTREIGIRKALGAPTGHVIRLIMRQGMKPALFGIVLGTLAALLLVRTLSSVLYSVKGTDPVTFCLVPAILLTVGAVACWLPARRATRMDPMAALRSE